MQKGDSSMSRNEKETVNVGQPEHPTTSRTTREQHEQPSVQKHSAISENWAQETIEDLDDFIESQGIYIRQ